MPAFITLSILLSYLVQTESPYLALLVTPITIYSGLTGIAVSIIGALVKKNVYPVWYDLFATAALLIWFSYWQPFFRNDAPMFYLFPLYFAFLTAMVSLLFINKRERFDQESIDHLKYFDEMGRFHPGWVISGVLAAILLPGQYLLFPIGMSLLIIRYTLSCCSDID